MGPKATAAWRTDELANKLLPYVKGDQKAAIELINSAVDNGQNPQAVIDAFSATSTPVAPATPAPVAAAPVAAAPVAAAPVVVAPVVEQPQPIELTTLPDYRTPNPIVQWVKALNAWFNAVTDNLAKPFIKVGEMYQQNQRNKIAKKTQNIGNYFTYWTTKPSDTQKNLLKVKQYITTKQKTNPNFWIEDLKNEIQLFSDYSMKPKK